MKENAKRKERKSCKDRKSSKMSTRYSICPNILPSVLVGILFEKGKGQHILRNPLIISSIVEKVSNNYFNFFVIFLYLVGRSQSIGHCSGGGPWDREHDRQAP